MLYCIAMSVSHLNFRKLCMRVVGQTQANKTDYFLHILTEIVHRNENFI